MKIASAFLGLFHSTEPPKRRGLFCAFNFAMLITAPLAVRVCIILCA